MEQFWNQSWNHVGMDRVNEYMGRTDMLPDPIIEYLKTQQAQSVCDAGCGCGIYSLKLALNGFAVSGFDVSPKAVELTKELLTSRNVDCSGFKASDILATGYDDCQFDAVISRDVIDHMAFRDGIAAVKELCRITKSGGSVLLTLDGLDSEYETEPHVVNSDGDFLFTEGKWKGMVFHPYTEQQIWKLAQTGDMKSCQSDGDGFFVVIGK